MIFNSNLPREPEVFRGTRSWTVGEALGTGGTAVVLAVVAEDGTVGVCKRPSEHRFVLTQAMRTRYQRELTLLADVGHPHVLRLLDLVDIDGERVGIFERAERSIHQALPREGRPLTADALSWLAQAADGLAALAEKGIVHRDITPKNLLLMNDGRLVVSDLGAARTLDDDTVTLVGEHLGSLIYASDRQAREPHAADFSDDVFSLGQVAYHLLTGRRPIGNPPHLKELRPDLPDDFVAVIDSLRDPDPRRRPRNGDALRFLTKTTVTVSTQAAVGLAESRLFDEAVDVVRRLIRFDGVEPDQDAAADHIAYELFVNRQDLPVDLRFARWRHKTYSSARSKWMLEHAQAEWEQKVVRELDLPVQLAGMPPTVESMEAVREDMIACVESFHRTSLWMQLGHEPGEVVVPVGLANFGDKFLRSAFIVGEVLLVLVALEDDHLDRILPLLPSRWLADFDEIDEALLSVARQIEVDSTMADSRSMLQKYRDGRRLRALYNSYMSSACRCRLTGRKVVNGGYWPVGVASEDCPFGLLEDAVRDLYDGDRWLSLWVSHPALAEVEYFANATATALAQI